MLSHKLALPLLAFLLTTAHAKSPEQKSLTYLKPDSIDIAALIPPPPVPDSAEAKAELALILKLQDARTPADVERFKSEKKLTLAAFTPAVGPWCTSENLPKLAALLNTLDTEAKLFTTPAKAHFNRPRPPFVDSHITPLADDKDEAYPSNHSTRGTLFALILAELIPDQKDKLLARGQEIGWDRVIGGVHYPTDVYAGRIVGQALARALFATPSFQAQLPAIRAEIQAARQPGAAAPPAR